MSRSAQLAIKLHLGISLLVLLLMMLAGLAMRTSQASWMELPPTLFYQIMTVHGAGMVGISALAGAGIMWYFLRKYVVLTDAVLWANLGLFLSGVVLILGAVFVGGYAGGWTFLWPLPAKSGGIWSAHAAAGFVGGLILIGLGFLAFYFDAALAITRRYGGLLRGLGFDQLISGKIDLSHPPTIVASTMVIIVNTLGTLVGAVVLVVTLANLYVPTFGIDALVAKNMIYFFGHVFINATIYMSVMAVYELLPLYAGRPWKVSRPFYAAWAAVTLFVMAVYPHHLLLDSVMPKSLLILGQVISYLSGIPVLLVTVWGALTLVHRSGMSWKAPARWLMLSLLGWSVGVIPAIVDGTLRVNQVMHNTLWVPGHFHFYLLVGLLPMIIGFCMHVFADRLKGHAKIEGPIFWTFASAASVFCWSFLIAGWDSVPRRWATHEAQWMSYDQWGSAAALLVILPMVLIVARGLRAVIARSDINDHGVAP